MTGGPLTFRELETLTAGKIGVSDTPCPVCGPSRHSPANRVRRVLRIWAVPGFATWHCPRCVASGWARDDGAARIEPERLQSLRREAAQRDNDHKQRQYEKAATLWRRSLPATGSIAEIYLRQARGYRGPISPTLAFLPAMKPEHHPAMIAAFGVPDEPEPGKLAIATLRGIHLTLLKPDGSGKAGTGRDKIMVGSSTGSPIVVAPLNDLLGLVVCEGIETRLSVFEATGCGVWAAGSAGRMAPLADAIPAYIDCVTINAEDDAAGRKGAIELADRLDALGIHCESHFLETEAAA